MKKKSLAIFMIGIFLVMAFFGTGALASTTVHGITFDDNAFPDVILEVNGTWDPAPQLSIFGPHSSYDYTYNPDRDENAYIKLGFIDNQIVNGAGNDLALFEQSGNLGPGGTGCWMRITINGVTNTYIPYWVEGEAYLSSINLDDFGVPSGGLVSTLTLWGGANDPEYMTVGALNNAAVPIPGAIWLPSSGLIGLVGFRKRFRKE